MSTGSPTATLHSLIEEQGRRTPTAEAVIDHEQTLTYQELIDQARRIAQLLADNGVRPDQPVGVLLDRSVGLMAALLGVLKAGGAYLPLEINIPPARLARLLDDAGAAVCLVRPDLAVAVTRAGATPLTLATLPATDGAVNGRAGISPVGPEHLCAVYYTSGSTGRPKGVACTHGGWANRMSWMQRTHHLAPGETVLHKTTLTFDDSGVELFWPLTVGGRVAILPPDLHRDPRAIIDAAARYQAVHLSFVPSMLDLFLSTLTDADVERLSPLRTVLSSGEALSTDLVRRFLARFGDRVRLENTWGATEVSIDSTCHDCGPADLRPGEPGVVGIGRPIDGNDVIVVDAELQPVPPGVPGELCIGGVGLARGYLGDPVRTAASFVPHPLGHGMRLYRTGDRGLVLPDGSLRFLGREDDQVKVRGIRIELGEIAAALVEHPEVADAAATSWSPFPGDVRLAAYVALVAGSTRSGANLMDYLRDVLPGYAVPATVMLLDGLPRLPNGKLDRRNLPEPELMAGHDSAYLEPRTVTEQALAQIWAAVLGVPRVGVEDNFFAIGGHSLLAIRVASRMRRVFDTDVPMSLLFEEPTVAGTAARLEQLILSEITSGVEQDPDLLAETQ